LRIPKARYQEQQIEHRRLKQVKLIARDTLAKLQDRDKPLKLRAENYNKLFHTLRRRVEKLSGDSKKVAEKIGQGEKKMVEFETKSNEYRRETIQIKKTARSREARLQTLKSDLEKLAKTAGKTQERYDQIPAERIDVLGVHPQLCIVKRRHKSRKSIPGVQSSVKISEKSTTKEKLLSLPEMQSPSKSISRKISMYHHNPAN
jgi:chromosome segregation ATPase